MPSVSFFGFWEPRIPLNTDIVAIEKFAPPKTAQLYTRELGLDLETGAAVKSGQRLAADVVSPVTGTVTEINAIRGLDGETLNCITLDVADKDEMQEGLEAVKDVAAQDREALLQTLSDLGFHTDLGADANTAVLSCLDTDPVHTVNQQTFRENAEAVGEAIAFLKALTGAKRVVFVTTKQLRNLAERHVDGQAEIAMLTPHYPNGLPEVLLRRLSEKVPDVAGAAVLGAERLFAMAAALKAGKPRQDKLVTLCAPGAGLCKTLRLRIGTPIATVLEHYQIDLSDHSKLITGGVMRGAACYSPDFAVTSTTDSIIVQDEANVVECENNACTNCGKCSTVCPMDLQVNMICRYSEYGLFDECRKLAVDNCIECGMCSFACTARRPLNHLLKLAMAEMAKEPEAGGAE